MSRYNVIPCCTKLIQRGKGNRELDVEVRRQAVQHGILTVLLQLIEVYSSAGSSPVFRVFCEVSKYMKEQATIL